MLLFLSVPKKKSNTHDFGFLSGKASHYLNPHVPFYLFFLKSRTNFWYAGFQGAKVSREKETYRKQPTIEVTNERRWRSRSSSSTVAKAAYPSGAKISSTFSIFRCQVTTKQSETIRVTNLKKQLADDAAWNRRDLTNRWNTCVCVCVCVHVWLGARTITDWTLLEGRNIYM